MPRRRFLGLAGGFGLGLAAGCAADDAAPGTGATAGPSSSATAAPSPTGTGLLRPGTAAGTLAASPIEIDLAGTVVTTWGYNGVVPGPEIRLKRGETVRARLTNALPDETTIHWHGVNLVNAMDGLPGLTQDPVRPGELFEYEFRVPDAGSYMYHAHVGHQLDLGLYGPLIVDSDVDEPLAYDREYTVMIDDWRDGLGVTEPGTHSGGHGPPGGIPFLRGGSSSRTAPAGATPSVEAGPEGEEDEEEAEPEPGANLGERVGGRVYPMYLINGRPAADPPTLEVRSGERVRLRLMNIGADTGFLVAIAGHTMTITHTDGMPVEPVEVEAVRLGMGERYDVVVTADNSGVWQLAAMPEAKRGFARAVLRYTDAAASIPPPVDERPRELTGRQASYDELHYAGERTRPATTPDRVFDLELSSNSRINDQRYPDAEPLEIEAGELVRFRMVNQATLAHPMHLHGHPFWVATPSGRGPLKDTMLVPPDGGEGSFDFIADNTGVWLFHCHNHYHMENGLSREVRYLT
ncbi:MAG: multicopper oxidase family protein [Sporichthya sp.]|nr:multicopper oxidase family protein [Sporichthya sp.]